MKKKYILHNVYNTLTGEYEDVEVSKELYVTYKRTGWGIENNDASFYDHEIQLSGLIGGENDNYENFHEFVDDENTPEDIVIDAEIKRAVRESVSALNKEEQKLVYALYEEGVSEREYARRTGIPQRTINHRKEKILEKIRKNKKFSK